MENDGASTSGPLTSTMGSGGVGEGGLGDEENLQQKIVSKINVLFKVVVLPLPDGMFTDLNSMWVRIWVWTLWSWLAVHVVGAVVAGAALRRHSKARWLPWAIVAAGLLSSLFVGGLLSALVAFSYHNSAQQMPDILAMLTGFAQSLLLLVLAFSRILPTL